MKLFAFAASLRQGSLNRRLIELAVHFAHESGAEVNLVEFSQFELPIYNQDMQDTEGFPPGAEALRRCFSTADAYLISSPEYNFSTPGTLKNALDWVSRYKPVPLSGKSGLLLSASPSLVGGNRGLWQLRVPLEALGSPVYPDMFSLAQADQAFNDSGSIKDPVLQDRLAKLIAQFIVWAKPR